jgi:hypothetical protein
MTGSDLFWRIDDEKISYTENRFGWRAAWRSNRLVLASSTAVVSHDLRSPARVD